MEQNYYRILEIPRDAEEREIKKAYHRMAREYHPDKADTPERARELEEKFALISTAYNTLKDPSSRADYDRKNFGGTTPEAEKAEATRQEAEKQAEEAGEGGPRAAPKAPAPKTMNEVKQEQKQAKAASQQLGGQVDEKRAAIASKAYAKGLKLLKERDLNRAAEFFEAAISNNPNEASYHARLASTLVESKKSVTRAIEAGQKAVELDKYNLDYKFNLAHIFQEIGSESKATEVYEAILKWDDKNEMAEQMLRDMKRKNSATYKWKKKMTDMKNKVVKPGGGLDKVLKEITKER